MNKNEWLKIKQSKAYPIEILYEFYISRLKPQEKEYTFEEFSKNFMDYFNLVKNVNNVLIDEFFDKKLGVTKLINNKNQIIKEY